MKKVIVFLTIVFVGLSQAQETSEANCEDYSQNAKATYSELEKQVNDIGLEVDIIPFPSKPDEIIFLISGSGEIFASGKIFDNSDGSSTVCILE
jgi:hypothetical protein